MAERNPRWYASREQVKEVYAEIGPTVAEKDDKIDALIETASRWIEEACGTHFYPITATRYYDHPEHNSGVLKLDQWLLSISAFTTENGDEAILPADYFLMCGNTYLPPYSRIVMNINGDVPYLSYNGTPQRANAVTGVWGYGNDYDNTGVTLDGAISSLTATTVAVSAGEDIEVGWQLLVDNEQMFVQEKTGDNLTVLRGQGGTTAATHSTGATIYRYVPPLDIEALCGILVARLFHRGSTSWSDLTGSEARGLLLPRQLSRLYMWALPAEGYLVIQRYKRRW